MSDHVTSTTPPSFVAEVRKRVSADGPAAAQRRHEEAERRNAKIEARVSELEGLLASRPRDLRSHRSDIEETFGRGGAQAIADLVARILASAPRPDGFPRRCDVGYAPESRELFITYELPRQDVVPVALGHRYVKARDAIDPVPRKEADVKLMYRRLLARTVLRALAGVFDAIPPALVGGAAINGYVAAKDRSTGKPIEPVLVRRWPAP